MATTDKLPAYLRPAEAADIARTTIATLASWRCRNQGPAFVKRGKSVLYKTADLLAWLEGNTHDPARVR